MRPLQKPFGRTPGWVREGRAGGSGGEGLQTGRVGCASLGCSTPTAEEGLREAILSFFPFPMLYNFISIHP